MSNSVIAIGCDHAALDLKNDIVKHLQERGLEYIDVGIYEMKSVDYPDYAHKVCVEIQEGRAGRGILICGTGIGMSMAANKHRGIRAALCSDTYSAKLTRMHNDANVLCMGARVLGPGLAVDIVDMFIDTEAEGGRHSVRVGKIMDNEKGWN